MKLIIFDIDGTLVDSVKTDDDCFKETFKTLYNIDLSTENWNDYNHVTDTGLTIQIFKNWLHKLPTESDIATIKSHFHQLLSHRMHEIRPITKAVHFINIMSSLSNFKIAFATGGWTETAKLKCSTVGLTLDNFVLKSSNDHFDRSQIIQLAISEVLQPNKKNKNCLESITYFGDGLWDYKTTMQLGIGFIGVDFKDNGKLKKAGCKTIIKDFNNIEYILQLIT